MTADWSARLDRCRTAMDEHGVDTLLLSVGSDLPYLTGYRAMPLERLTMLVVPSVGDAVLIVPELEALRVEPGPFELLPWSETEEPLDLVVRRSGRPTLAAIGDQTWARFLVGLLGRMAGTTFVSATPVMMDLRIVKDSDEIARLAAAAAAADRVVARIPNEIDFSGRTEREVSRRIIDMTLEEGHDTAEFWIVASGPNAASPHHEPGDRVIEPGDVVVVDFGGAMDGYRSDVSRTFVVGEPSTTLAEVHAVVASAQEAGRAAATAGTPCSAVDAAARQVIVDAGYGEYFIHRTGHGIGLDGHEEPYLVAGNDRALEPGMAFSVEPGVYLPGELGVRIEDICVATDGPARTLNQADRGLVPVS